MKKIDQETVNRILDAADIVEVVSDFVNLKRRGANYIGLCPFHNERTPSFSVSKAKGICKCFSCGKGGSPVGFIMEHEQLSYNEALRYLAKKYNIEIKEHEMSAEEQLAATERESMLAINEFALNHFEHNLTDTDDGRNIGLAYFRERGINDLSIKRFRLGYSLDTRNDLLRAALAKGYNEKYLVDTGLCIRNDRGDIYDRFKGRVMYPVMSVSGKVVAFGGRTLRKDKEVAKYVNSPESTVYRKSYELYGLYQAKQAIVKKNKCILVEGYMDVISMHQSGIENVVASSGTSLTEGQIRLIHRFTENVTVIYDSDPAGIKASLRGIDMLLSEGLDIKVLLLPDGDDPDSFAQHHTTAEVEAYLAENETDFIRFKTRILLDGVEDDPIKRSKAISDIVQSIACIPNEITRTVYIKECSRSFGIDDKVLTLQIAKTIASKREKQFNQRQGTNEMPDVNPPVEEKHEESHAATKLVQPSGYEAKLYPTEKELLRYVLKYGVMDLCEEVDADGNTVPLKVIDFINEEMVGDAIDWQVPIFKRTFETAWKLYTEHWNSDFDRFRQSALEERQRCWDEGENEIKNNASDLSDIRNRELILQSRCDETYNKALDDFKQLYIEKALASCPDDEIRSLTIDLVSERHHLSKVHTKYAHVETEAERLEELIPKAIFCLKDAHVSCKIIMAKERLKQLYSTPGTNMDEIMAVLADITRLNNLRSEFARNLGDRVVTPGN